MNNIGRYLIYTFIAVFVVVTTVYIVLFSLGLKIDWANFSLRQTGMVSVKTEPAGAQILVDGEEVKDSSPTRIRWISPGKYKLLVKKDGYHSYKDSIEVEPGLVTEKKHLRLFLKEPKLEKITKVDSFYSVDDSSNGYFVKKNKIYFSSVSPSRTRLIYESETPIKSVSLDDTTQKAIINQDKVINLLNGKNMLSINKEIPGARSCSFQPSKEDYLICRKNKTLLRVNINNLARNKILNLGRYSSYVLEDSKILAITNLKTSTLEAISYNGETQKILSKNILINSGDDSNQDSAKLSDLKLKKIDSTTLFVSNKGKSYLLSGEDQLIFLEDNIKSIVWPSSDQLLLTTKLNEVIIIDNPANPGSRRRAIVNRLSSVVYKVRRLDNRYLVFLSADKIYISAQDDEQIIEFDLKNKVQNFWTINDNQLIIENENGQLSIMTLS